MKHDVFISYSSKDYVDEQKNVIPGNEVSKIKDALSKAGITYWFDEEGIYSGQNFVEKIVTNIEDAKIFLFLSTANANKSPWTCKEIASADELEKHIIPVRIDASPYNRKVLFRIADLNYIEYYTNPEKGMNDLINSIQVYLEEWVAKERRKQDEDNRLKEQDDTILRKHREDKLRECHENIKKLEQQREDFLNKRINLEKVLVEINSNLNLLEQELTTLKEDERILLETNRTSNEKEDENNPHDGIFYKEINDLIKAFTSRHLIVNIIELLVFIYFIVAGFVLLCMTIISTSNFVVCSCLTAYSYVGFVGIYRLMKNSRDCLYWLVPIFPFVIPIVPFMFIRKNKLSAWKVLQNSSVRLRDDPVYIIMIFFLVIGVLGIMALSLYNM